MSRRAYVVRIGSRTLEVTLAETRGVWSVEIEGRRHRVDRVRTGPDGAVHLLVDGKGSELVVHRDALRSYRLSGRSVERRVEVQEAWLQRFSRVRGRAASTRAETVRAPIPGTVVRILVGPGDSVKADQTLLVLEAMKMQNEILSPVDGRIGAVHVAEGQAVPGEQPLVTVERVS